MRKKLLYTMSFLFCFSLMASSNNYKESGKEKKSPCELAAKLEEEQATEEILESWPLNHFLLSLAEW
ncbi:MAG: hypothetical protein ACHQEM_02205 [Chitinophagales bacterium]